MLRIGAEWIERIEAVFETQVWEGEESGPSGTMSLKYLVPEEVLAEGGTNLPRKPGWSEALAGPEG